MNKQHEKILYLYSVALDAGDFDAISQIWEKALDDDELSAKLVEFGLETNDEEMQMLPQSNGKPQPYIQPQITPLVVGIASPSPIQKRRLTRVAIILFGFVLLGVFAYMTFYAQEPVHTTLIQENHTPTPTPFVNPIKPTLSYTTHEPILNNGKGVLSFQYPEKFSVSEGEDGIIVGFTPFRIFGSIVPPGDTRGNLPLANENQSVDDYVAILLDPDNGIFANPAVITQESYIINNRQVVELSGSGTYFIMDTSAGPLVVGTNYVTTQLSRDVFFEILPTIQYDPTAEPIPYSYENLAENALSIELEENVLLTTSFSADERGLAYTFIGNPDETFIISATNEIDMNAPWNPSNQINIYLLDASGQLLASVSENDLSMPTHVSIQAFIHVPEAGSYTLLMMPDANDNKTIMPQGGEYTIYLQPLNELLPDETQSGVVYTGYPHYFTIHTQFGDYLQGNVAIPDERQLLVSQEVFIASDAPMYQIPERYTWHSIEDESDAENGWQEFEEFFAEDGIRLIILKNSRRDNSKAIVRLPDAEITQIEYQITFHAGEFSNDQ